MPDNKRLVLSTSPRLRAALLCLLYFCQGFPWGFATIALVATLSAQGYPKAETASIVALSILPWTFKFFWAPIIDSVRFPSLGNRRPWLIFAQTGIAVMLLVPVVLGTVSNDSSLMFLAWTFFAVNCFCSMQDVCTDALAVDLLSPTERGRILSFMWASQITGIALGGAGMAIVIDRSGIPTAMLMQAAMVIAVMLLIVAVYERPGNRRFPWEPHDDHVEVDRPFGFMITIKELIRALSNRTTFTLVFIAFAYKLVEGIYEPLVAELLIQDFGWTAAEFATRQGTFGMGGEFIGALVGGFMADRFGRRKMAFAGLAGLMSVLCGFALSQGFWSNPDFPVVLLLPVTKFMIAFTTVSMFTLFVKVSWTTAAATQFTLYMAMSNLGHAAGAKVNSWFAGYGLTNADFFMLAGLTQLLPMLMLIVLDPDSVAARREAEEAVLEAG